jgi:rhodanese-related sulfurtransferase
MTKSIFDQAQQRGASLPYAGAVTPQEAYELLQSDPAVLLIDVRTNAERDWVGQVQISPGQLHSVQWNLYPSKSNPDFLAELKQVASTDNVLLFLCRSGVRSKAAAQLATEHGYPHCYDILEGFEGDKDALGHRKNVNGWCYAGLPWRGA